MNTKGHGATALHWAIRAEEIKTVKANLLGYPELLARKADLNIVDD